jgi:hypothetical protein
VTPRVLLVAGPLLLALVAGCTAPDPDADATGDGAGVVADFITPGAWDVRGGTDHMFAWAHNAGDSETSFDWSLTLAGGAPLPDGWQVSFQPASATLAANGTKTAGPRPTYPDWAGTRITLTLPASQGAGTHAIELHAGDAVAEGTLAVAAERGTVSGPGSRVTVHYDGRFADDGSRFDEGEFPTTLGSGQTVPCFDNGLMGLAVGETATLVIPPAFAYGYDNPPGPYAKFNGRTLAFTVTMKSIA